jgi:Putative binding domain, N-terminal/Viral BACON domain
MLLRPVVMRIVLIVLAAAAVCSCETSSTVSQGPSPVKCLVTLASPPMMDAGGGSGSLAITTQPECAWEVSSTASWISGFTPASGQGTATVSFRVTANDGSSTRDGMIVVNGEQARVSQRAPCRYEVVPGNQSVSASGGASSINIATTSDCSWSAVSEASWIALSSSPSGSGNGTVNFTVAPNPGEARSGAIAIAVANQRANITQAGVSAPPPPSCSANISPTSQNIAAAGGTGTVTVSATCQWTATSGATWITISSGAAGTGNGTVSFTVANNTGAARTGTLSIAGRTFTVTQAGSSSPTPPPPASCSYSISPRSDSVPALGDTGNVDVSTTSACAWTASSNASWITLSSGVSGTGNGRVGYLVLPNVGGSRTGTLTVAGETFTVSQAALSCSYSISPGNQKVEASAGTGTVTVSTNSACTWTASSNASWITVTSGASGTGNGTVTYSYTANTGGDRKGTLTVAGRNFTLEQNKR